MAHFNQMTADNECATAVKLRESLALAREKCKMDYLAQYEATNYQLRRRSYETNRLKLELEFQRKNVSKIQKRSKNNFSLTAQPNSFNFRNLCKSGNQNMFTDAEATQIDSEQNALHPFLSFTLSRMSRSFSATHNLD